jgi:hypothetical protein
LVTNVENSITQKKPKRVKKENTNIEKRKTIVNNVVKHKKPKDFDKA